MSTSPEIEDRDLGRARSRYGESTCRSLEKLSATQSTTIMAARVLCIVFVTSSHAWPGAGRILTAEVSLPYEAFYLTIVGLLGKSSVPLLSLISGLLFVSSFYRRGSDSVIRGKFKTLIIPMVAWSIPMIVILYVEPLVTGRERSSWSAMEWLNLLFSINAEPANGPLHFFRDIFVMAIYGCIILRVFGKSPVLGLAIAVAIVLLEQKSGGFLVFRNQIAFFYIAGILLALSGRSDWRPGWLLVIVGLAFYAILAWAGALAEEASNIWHQRFSQLLPRISVSLLMWRMAYEIARRGGALREGILKLEPHIFVVFCSHALVAKGFSLFALAFGWSEESIYYPAILLVQMIAFVIFGVILSNILTPFPWLRGKTGRTSQAKSGI